MQDYMSRRSILPEALKNHPRQADALTDIVIAFLGSQTYDMAIDAANAIEEVERRVSTIEQIALKLVQSGDGDRAIALIQTITDAETRKSALASLSVQSAQLGQFEVALAIAQLLKQINQAEAVANMANTFDMVEEEETMIQTTPFINEDASVSYSLQEIAINLAEYRQFDKAIRIARSIESPLSKTRALAEFRYVVPMRGNMSRRSRCCGGRSLVLRRSKMSFWCCRH
jgi:tetratricopeptide (TPR) repeat protein